MKGCLVKIRYLIVLYVVAVIQWPSRSLADQRKWDIVTCMMLGLYILNLLLRSFVRSQVMLVIMSFQYLFSLLIVHTISWW